MIVNLFNTDSITIKSGFFLGIQAVLLCSLLYLNEFISEKTHEFDETRAQYEDVDRKTLELELLLTKISADEPHLQDEVLDRTRDIKDSFDKLYKDRYVRHDSTAFVDSVSFSYHNLDEEQKILMECHDLFIELLPICNQLSYKTISEDSLVKVFSTQEIYNSADSSMKRITVVEEEEIRVLTKHSKEQIRRAWLLAKNFKRELSALETIYNQKVRDINEYRYYFNILLAIILVFSLFLFYMYLRRHVFLPLKDMYLIVRSSNRYHEYESFDYNVNHEISNLSKAFSRILKEINVATHFVLELGGTKTTVTLENIKELNTPLSNSLVVLNEKLSDLESQRKRTDWSLNGQAVFAELVGKHNDNFEVLVDKVTKQFVKTLGAKQGALYVINRNNDYETMDIRSCYAYDQKKIHSASFTIGEGLVGQVWLEEKSLYLKDIPEDHPNIKSGLGDSSPVSLLIVPLKTHSTVYGVLELASFSEFDSHEIEFVEKVGESIAATISIVEINNNTQVLLKEAEILAVKMGEKEEENQKRINELRLHQEDVQRKEIQKDREQKIIVEKYDEQLLLLNQQISQYQEKIAKLNDDVEFAANNSEKVNELNTLVENMTNDISDLKETIKIKDMRIEKLRKRIQKNTE